MLEEDVAFSSIAKNEIGHARAVYSLLSEDADALAFDRKPEAYRCAPLVELHLLEWAHTIARRWLYEVADEIRITALKDLWPYALGVLPPELRGELLARVGLPELEAIERGTHTDELGPLWEEMT